MAYIERTDFKKMRELCGLSVTRVAKILGVTRAWVHNFEKGIGPTASINAIRYLVLVTGCGKMPINDCLEMLGVPVKSEGSFK